MKRQQLCININKRTQRLPELIEELSMEDGLSKTGFIYKIVREENERRIEKHRHRTLLGVWKQLKLQMQVMN